MDNPLAHLEHSIPATPGKGERILQIGGAIAGIIGVYLIYKKAQATAASNAAIASGTTTPTTDTTATGTTASSVDPTGILSQIESQVAALQSASQTSVTFAYSTNSGSSLSNNIIGGNSSQTGSNSGTASGNTSLLGLFGQSGSANSSGTYANAYTGGSDNLTTVNNDAFTADTTLTGASQSEIQNVEDFLTSLTGTYAQRVAGSTIAAGNGYAYQNPGEQDPNVTGVTSLSQVGPAIGTSTINNTVDGGTGIMQTILPVLKAG